MHDEQHIIKEKKSHRCTMHIDRQSGTAIIIGISIIVGTFSMVTLPNEVELEDPWSFQTMRAKLMNTESSVSEFNVKP